jgi:hypothetical protein
MRRREYRRRRGGEGRWVRIWLRSIVMTELRILELRGLSEFVLGVSSCVWLSL